eukprot:NODE_3014_length_2106_cov_9.532087.p1 GENE.NODE_3014_length_2106_cov_9.532087~~NODE_3014_length_2106_cov_9.532087.p1  ORF type:complete len:383 (-),score=112.79 NODE_3014_length_2106_cov_9.532087:754-1902(-)
MSIVLLYIVELNEWRSPVGPARPWVGGHLGEPPILWRPVDYMGQAPLAPLLAWVVESTPSYLLLLAPVSRDGVQRGPGDAHTALHFIGHDGEVVSHHLACKADRLTVQRYQRHLLVVKDHNMHPEGVADACLDDDHHPSYPSVAGWLLAAEDVAVPPLPVILPTEGCNLSGGWSLAITRGSIEELVSSGHLRFDTAWRLYLFEAGTQLRLWASRRIDEAFDTVYRYPTLDGEQLLRHALGFTMLPQTEVEAPGSGAVPGAWALWSPDLLHAARVDADGRLSFWRCAIAYEGEEAPFQALHHVAYGITGHAQPTISSVGVIPTKTSWMGTGLPPAEAGGGVVTGLPCFPALRWTEGTLNRPEDTWTHPIGRDAAQHVPSYILR